MGDVLAEEKWVLAGQKSLGSQRVTSDLTMTEQGDATDGRQCVYITHKGNSGIWTTHWLKRRQ